jgi:hypothetical protein
MAGREVRGADRVDVDDVAQRLLGDLVGVGEPEREVRGQDPARRVDAGVELAHGGGDRLAGAVVRTATLCGRRKERLGHGDLLLVPGGRGLVGDSVSSVLVVRCWGRRCRPTWVDVGDLLRGERVLDRLRGLAGDQALLDRRREPNASSIATSLSAFVLTPDRSMSAASAKASISLAFASPAGRGEVAVELALRGGLAEVAAEDRVVEPLAGHPLLRPVVRE